MPFYLWFWDKMNCLDIRYNTIDYFKEVSMDIS